MIMLWSEGGLVAMPFVLAAGMTVSQVRARTVYDTKM